MTTTAAQSPEAVLERLDTAFYELVSRTDPELFEDRDALAEVDLAEFLASVSTYRPQVERLVERLHASAAAACQSEFGRAPTPEEIADLALGYQIAALVDRLAAAS
jgi:hypothetical protein